MQTIVHIPQHKAWVRKSNRHTLQPTKKNHNAQNVMYSNAPSLPTPPMSLLQGCIHHNNLHTSVNDVVQ